MKNRNGYLTIEATLIFSSVFLVVIATIYMCIALYQISYLNSLADSIAQRSAAVWPLPFKEFRIGFIDEKSFDNKDLYWNFSDSYENLKKTNAKLFSGIGFDKFSLLGFSKNTNVDISVNTNNFITKNIKVKITTIYKNPVANVLRTFGAKDAFIFTANSEANICEPAEFVRNIDFAKELTTDINNKTNGSIDKIRDYISKIFSNF